jgi:hypothetical protein
MNNKRKMKKKKLKLLSPQSGVMQRAGAASQGPGANSTAFSSEAWVLCSTSQSLGFSVFKMG